jgi:hypothetical protein
LSAESIQPCVAPFAEFAFQSAEFAPIYGRQATPSHALSFLNEHFKGDTLGSDHERKPGTPFAYSLTVTERSNEYAE